MRHSETDYALSERAVIKSAVILHPCRVRCILMQMLRAYMMMLSINHAPKAS